MENGPLQIDAGRKLLTTFCVFHLTRFSHPSILQLQIRGTWKRHTDRVETEGPARTEHIPLLSENFEREVLDSAPVSAAEHLLLRPTAKRRPQRRFGVLRRLACDCSAVVCFLAWQLTNPEPSCVRFSPGPEAQHGPRQGSKIVGSPRTLAGSGRAGGMKWQP